MSADNHTTSETFRDIPGFPGYRVSDRGRVQSCRVLGSDDPRRGGKARMGDHWRDLHPFVVHTGYIKINLCKGGKAYGRHVHDLVLEAFVGLRLPGQQCRHLDCDKRNNHLSNLCWGTPKENSADTVRFDRQPKGEANGNAKLTSEQVIEIRELFSEGVPRKILAERYMVGRGYISAIINGKKWKHLLP